MGKVQTTVVLEEEQLEWVKDEDSMNFSGFVRKCLNQRMEESERPPEKRLRDLKDEMEAIAQDIEGMSSERTI